MNILFEENKYRPILRLYIPFWNAEKIMADTLAYCKGTGIRDLLLFSDAQYLVWNQLSRDEVLRECAVLTTAVKYFKEHGFRTVGINTSLMQMQSRADHRRHEDYDHWLTYADGSTDHRLPCPLDPKLMDYIDFFYGKLAKTGADFIYMDDDLRYMYNGSKNTLGCMCPLHLKAFSGRTGKKWTAKTLSEALLEKPAVRKEFLKLLGESLNDIASRIRQAVKQADKRVRVGLMVPCTNSISTSGGKLADTAAAISGTEKPLLRPCIGPYQDYDRKFVFAGLFHLELTRHLFKNQAEYTPELETSPSTTVSKSCTVSRFYIIQGILNRMPAPLFTPVGYCGDTPFIEPAYPEMFRRSGKYFERLTALAPDPEKRIGVHLFGNIAVAQSCNDRIRQVNELFFPCCAIHNVLDSAGIPHTYEDSGAAFLCGIHAAPLSDREIRSLLKKSLLIDGHAASILTERGFGPEIGIRNISCAPHCGSEKAVSEEFFGFYTGSYLQSRMAPAGTVYRLNPMPDAEELSSFCDHDLKRVGPAVIRFVNRYGGKIAVLPYAVTEGCAGAASFHLICAQRQQMLRNLFRWMAPEVMQFEMEIIAECAVQLWQEPGRTILALTNFSYDERASYKVKTTLPLGKAQCLSDSGKLRPLRFRNGVLHERLKPFRPLIIFPDHN